MGQVIDRHVETVVTSERESAQRGVRDIVKKKQRADAEILRLRERVAKAEKSAARRKKQREEAMGDGELKEREIQEKVLELKRSIEQVDMPAFFYICLLL